MSVLDLKDAYFSVKIAAEYQCFLKFEWDKVLYVFVCYPDGLGPCPRKFTKIYEAPLSDLKALQITLSQVTLMISLFKDKSICSVKEQLLKKP